MELTVSITESSFCLYRPSSCVLRAASTSLSFFLHWSKLTFSCRFGAPFASCALPSMVALIEELISVLRLLSCS